MNTTSAARVSILLSSNKSTSFAREQMPSLNVITEYIIGYLYPGYPVANICFKVYGFISMKQAITFLQDFKLGHYMKIPPRAMFMAQVSILCIPLPKLKWRRVFYQLLLNKIIREMLDVIILSTIHLKRLT